MNGGVSITFFCAAVKALGRIHGANRGCGEPIERLRKHLADAEAAYLELPVLEKKPRRRPSNPKSKIRNPKSDG